MQETFEKIQDVKFPINLENSSYKFENCLASNFSSIYRNISKLYYPLDDKDILEPLPKELLFSSSLNIS